MRQNVDHITIYLRSVLSGTLRRSDLEVILQIQESHIKEFETQLFSTGLFAFISYSSKDLCLKLKSPMTSVSLQARTGIL